MLRMQVITDVNSLSGYLGKGDGGYFVEQTGLHREIGGEVCQRLGLTGPEFKKFLPLIHGLNPNTGGQLTSKLVDHRIPGWHLTASIPKGVTIALERGDHRIHAALWEAVRETIADIAARTTTRVRKGGEQADRVTGNLGYYAEEHAETRPTKADSLPDMDRHIHIIIPNLTWDPIEKEIKAIKYRPIMDLRKWFDRSLDARLARKLTDLGYNIETRMKPDKRYYTWDIKDMPRSVVEKFSRRTAEVEALAEKLGIDGPAKDKLGATSRQFKRDDMTLADYRKYWDERVTPEEARGVAEVIRAAMLGQNPPQRGSVREAVEYSLLHNFERQSVVREDQVAITALERGMGVVRPEDVMPEAKRQGLLVRDGEATTKAVLAEEKRVIAFARDGRGTCRPMGSGAASGYRAQYLGLEDRNVSINTYAASGGAKSELPLESNESNQPPGDSVRKDTGSPRTSDTATPSPEKQAVSRARSEPQNSSLLNPKQGENRAFGAHGSAPPQHRLSASVPDENRPSSAPPLSPDQLRIAHHVWESPDRVILIRGAAGTGKTHTMKATSAGIDRPVVVLAPSADASRGVLRKEGFQDADTVSRFLTDKQFQQKARNGVIWVDEAGMIGIRQMREVFDLAESLNARVVLQGDRKQHGSVERGATLRVLEQYAGLPIAQLTDVRRQKGKYKEAVSLLAEGKITDGYDKLNELGWVKQTGLVEDYLAALDSGKEVLAIAPTHVEAAEVTAAIRDGLKARGVLGEEHTVKTLTPLHWTEAERGDLEHYSGDEVIQFHRNGGTFKAGDRIAISDFKTGQRLGKANGYAVYSPAEIPLAAGDKIRITSNGWTSDKKHRLDNGSQYTVAGFEKDGKIRLTNGWFLSPEFKHLTHGYVTTSHASQGKTVDKIFIAMGHESLPAISAEQFYVSVSRGREQATIYSSVSPDVLREAIQRADTRKSATELIQPRRKEWWLSRRARAVWFALRARAETAMQNRQKQRENGHGR